MALPGGCFYRCYANTLVPLQRTTMTRTCATHVAAAVQRPQAQGIDPGVQYIGLPQCQRRVATSAGRMAAPPAASPSPRVGPPARYSRTYPTKPVPSAEPHDRHLAQHLRAVDRLCDNRPHDGAGEAVGDGSSVGSGVSPHHGGEGRFGGRRDGRRLRRDGRRQLACRC